MDWTNVGNTWLSEAGDLSFAVRWSGGTWYWRAVYYEGNTTTAQFAGDNSKEQPGGFIRAEDAMRAAERWYKVLMGET